MLVHVAPWQDVKDHELTTRRVEGETYSPLANAKPVLADEWLDGHYVARTGFTE